MSVVAARVYNDRIVMAADSIVVRGWSKDTKRDFSKINEINGMIVGSVGSAEEGSLFQNFMRTHKPDSATEKDVLSFVIEFSNYKRGLTGDYKMSNDYLLAVTGHLFFIHNMLVYEIKEYGAIGAGEDFANAALYLGHSASEAVDVACNLCCMVSEPIIEYAMNKEE